MRQFVGKLLEALPLRERRKLTGKWVALEIYTPETLPLRIIEAAGDTATECIHQLRARNLDVGRYEFMLMSAPY